MGYLKEPIELLRQLQATQGNSGSDSDDEHPLVALLASMPSSFSEQRLLMINRIMSSLLMSGAGLDRDRLDVVLEAMGSVPRETFVSAEVAELAYLPSSVRIGHGQTISHPEIVAIMTYAVAPLHGLRVLDVGTGSGYQAAILSRLADHVVTIEIVAELAREAHDRLRDGGYENVECMVGDACSGVLPGGLFDAIVVAAGGAEIPDALLSRLAVGGRMVMPVGTERSNEQLILVERLSNGEYARSNLGPVGFVPLTGVAGRSGTATATSPVPAYRYGRPITPARK